MSSPVVILILSGIFVLTFVSSCALTHIRKRRSQTHSESSSGIKRSPSAKLELAESSREKQIATALHEFRPHQEQYPLASFANPILQLASPTPCYPMLSPPPPAYTHARTL